MARFESDCTTLTGWSEVWNTNGVYTVTAKAAARSGSVFRYSAAANYESFLRFTAADAQNIDAVMVVYHPGTLFQPAMIACRASGTANTPATYNGYVCGVRYDGAGSRFVVLYKMVAGTRSTVTATSITARTPAGANRFMIRLNVTGTTSPVSIKAKAWLYDSPEPAAWDIDTTDSSTPFTASGYTGVYANVTESGQLDFDYLGVDTTGSTLLIVPEVPLATAMTLATYDGTINFMYPNTENIDIVSVAPVGLVKSEPDFAAMTFGEFAPVGSVAFLPPKFDMTMTVENVDWFKTITLAASTTESILPIAASAVNVEIPTITVSTLSLLPSVQSSLESDIGGRSNDNFAPMPDIVGIGNFEIFITGAV